MNKAVFQPGDPGPQPPTETDKWTAQELQEEKWPLVVAFLIAFPIIVVFALAMSSVRESGESLSVLAAFLMGTGLIMVLLSVTVFVIRKFRDRKKNRECRTVWAGPSAEDQHLDTWFDPLDPLGKTREDGPREFSVGPGLGLRKRYRRPLPTPKRRI